MKIDEFKPGDKVRYVPTHAEGNSKHKDCENGIVSSIGKKSIFVRYQRHGILQQTAEGTDPYDLIKI